MIVATAGHVDHGKTHLIRALTGVDTDRLEEEKRRGMTIDLGFAYVDLGGQRPAGFIDVPGHERFVRTMAAGVHHLDLALLVVAADDGPMPQTREHLSLLKGLGLSELAIVLTKIDRVDAAHRSRARNAALALLEGTPLASPPVFEVNTLDGEGIDALKAYLGARQQAHDAQTRVPRGHARLAIDRAFSLPGAGLIVTGLLLDGQLAVGDELILSPRGEAVRVRGLRVHEQPASLAHAGTRCAVNLSGARSAAAELGRGDWLVAEALASSSERIDAVFTLNAEIDKPLTARAHLQCHLGASCIGVRVAPLTGRAIAGGSTSLVQLLLEQPTVALHGDRFVLRDPAAQQVLGQGRVLDPFGASKGRSKPERIAWLQILEGLDPQSDAAQQAFEQGLQALPCGIDLADFARRFNLRDADESALVKTSQPVMLGRLAVAAAQFRRWREALLERVRAEHAQHPARIGPSEGLLLQSAIRQCAPSVASGQALPVARGALLALVQEGALVRDGHGIRCADHVPLLTAEQQARLDAVRSLLLDSGLRPPIAGELAAALGTTREDMLAFLHEMGSLGHLVPVAPNRYFLQADVSRLAQIARELAEGSPQGQFDAAAYRDASGIGRNLTIEVLEYLDRQGITRRIGQRRVIRSSA